jgi:hypothetical protein
MLGFVLGVLFVLALPRRQAEAPPQPALVPVASEAPKAATPLTPPRLTTIEAVFAEWGKYAVWERDVTEVALYDSQTKDFSDDFEVLRFGDDYYFRSIPRLTRPVLTHGLPAGSPLRYTETEEQRKEWLRDSSEENWQALGHALVPRPPAAESGDKHP